MPAIYNANAERFHWLPPNIGLSNDGNIRLIDTVDSNNIPGHVHVRNVSPNRDASSNHSTLQVKQEPITNNWIGDTEIDLIEHEEDVTTSGMPVPQDVHTASNSGSDDVVCGEKSSQMNLVNQTEATRHVDDASEMNGSDANQSVFGDLSGFNDQSALDLDAADKEEVSNEVEATVQVDGVNEMNDSGGFGELVSAVAYDSDDDIEDEIRKEFDYLVSIGVPLPKPKLFKIENQDEDVTNEHAPTENNHQAALAEATEESCNETSDKNHNEAADRSRDEAANVEFHMVYGRYERVEKVKYINKKKSNFVTISFCKHRRMATSSRHSTYLCGTM